MESGKRKDFAFVLCAVAAKVVASGASQLRYTHVAYSSFSEFVAALEKAGELKRITGPVATELEITELADREMKSPGGGKALLIEKPTVNGEVSPFPVAINTMGSWKRMAMAMNAESVDAAAAELGALMKAKPPTSLRETMKLLGQAIELRHARPRLVKDGPCKESVHKFDAPPPAPSRGQKRPM